jgi:hypothetical protein
VKEKMPKILLIHSKVSDSFSIIFSYFLKLPLVASKVSVEPVMFCLGSETSQFIRKNERTESSSFAA